MRQQCPASEESVLSIEWCGVINYFTHPPFYLKSREKEWYHFPQFLTHWQCNRLLKVKIGSKQKTKRNQIATCFFCLFRIHSFLKAIRARMIFHGSTLSDGYLGVRAGVNNLDNLKPKVLELTDLKHTERQITQDSIFEICCFPICSIDECRQISVIW